MALYHSPNDYVKLAGNIMDYADKKDAPGNKLKRFVKDWDYKKIRKSMETLYMEIMSK